MCNPIQFHNIRRYTNEQDFPPIALALIASATDKALAEYVEYLKHENKILRKRLPKQVHTKQEERQTLSKFGKVIGQSRYCGGSRWSPISGCHNRWPLDRADSGLSGGVFFPCFFARRDALLQFLFRDHRGSCLSSDSAAKSRTNPPPPNKVKKTL